MCRKINVRHRMRQAKTPPLTGDRQTNVKTQDSCRLDFVLNTLENRRESQLDMARRVLDS